jgi:hypothetical protein
VQHLVAEVVERDGLEQPEICPSSAGGTVGRSLSGGGSVQRPPPCRTSDGPGQAQRTGTYVDPWTLYSVNAKAGLIGT